MSKKVFFIRLSVFIVLAVIMDIGVTAVLEKLYFSAKKGGAFATSYVLNTTKAEIITFGSSTVSHAFIPEIFEDSLHMSCYNAGRDGLGVLYGYANLTYLLDRYTPKIVIIDVGEADIIKSSFGTTASAFLSPYYGKNHRFDSLLYSNKFDKIKMLSGIYRYNSKLHTIANGHLKGNLNAAEFDKGYVKLSGTKAYENVEESKNTEIDPDRLSLLENFIDLALENNCKVILTTAPIDTKGDFAYASYVRDIAERKKIPYLNNYSNEIFRSDKKLFYDLAHLNDEGAIKYTNMFITYIKNNMIN